MLITFVNARDKSNYIKLNPEYTHHLLSSHVLMAQVTRDNARTDYGEELQVTFYI